MMQLLFLASWHGSWQLLRYRLGRFGPHFSGNKYIYLATPSGALLSGIPAGSTDLQLHEYKHDDFADLASFTAHVAE